MSAQSCKVRQKRVVCYFSAGSFENDRPDGQDLSTDCYCNRGDECKMDGWEEWWLDIHSAACKKNVQGVMSARIALAATKGCSAIEPDNVDSSTNDGGGHGNTEADQLAYNLWLATEAHRRGLGIGLKNSGDLVKKHGSAIVDAFDFVVVEQCVCLPFAFELQS